MSSNKGKTAFARTPRGNRSGAAAPATFQINKQFLDRMTQARLAPDMATVLTKTSAELAITIQPNGKGNFTINSSGQVIGDSADVQKVQSLGTFINDERKSIVKTSVSAMAKKTIAALVMVSKEQAFADQVPHPISRIDKAFVDIFRTVSAQADMLESNLQHVTQVEAIGSVNEGVRNHLIESGKRIRESLGSYLLYRGGLAEGDEPRKLNDFLLEAKVIGWVFARLTSQKLQLGGKDFEFRKVYFPKDPTKGICLSYRELKDKSLVENQGGILVNMSVFRGIWNDEVVRSICGIPKEWDLTDFTGPSKVLSNVPFLVVPSPGAVTSEEHFSLLAKEGDRGLAWNVGNTVNPQDILRYLGTIPKRVTYGFIGKARFSAPWYEVLFPGFKFDAAVIDRDGRSVFAQLQSQFRAGKVQSEFFTHSRGEGGYAKARSLMPPLILNVMDMPSDNDVAKDLIKHVGADMKAIPNGETQATADSWAAIMTRRQMTDELCASTLNGVLAVNLDPRSKDVKMGDVRMARSGLSPNGALLLREFKRRGYHTLAARIDQWLRSFLTTALQAAVAEVIAARLEASLATPIKFDRGDTTVFLESAEFAPESEAPEDDNSSIVSDEVNPDDK